MSAPANVNPSDPSSPAVPTFRRSILNSLPPYLRRAGELLAAEGKIMIMEGA